MGNASWCWAAAPASVWPQRKRLHGRAAKYGSGNIRAGGSIVFTSGTAGRRPRTGWTLVASVCAAMEGLTRALAVELAPIRVNIGSPYVVKTALWAEMAEADPATLDRRTQR